MGSYLKVSNVKKISVITSEKNWLKLKINFRDGISPIFTEILKVKCVYRYER